MFDFFVGVLAALGAFFVVGELGFWLLLGGVFCCTWYQVSRSRGFAALALIIGSGLFVQFVSRLDVLGWVAENWVAALVWAGCYVVIGGLYALFRWNLHASRKSRELDEWEAKFRRSDPQRGDITGPFDLQTKLKFNRFLFEGGYRPDIEYTGYFSATEFIQSGVLPTAKRNKYVVGRWVWWWPWSALGWFLDDFIQELYRIVSQGLEGLMDYMARRIFGERAALGMTAEELRTLEQDEAHRREDERQPRYSK